MLFRYRAINQFNEPCPTSNTVPCTDANSINRRAQPRARSLASLNDSVFAEYPAAQIILKSTDHITGDNRGKDQLAWGISISRNIDSQTLMFFMPKILADSNERGRLLHTTNAHLFACSIARCGGLQPTSMPAALYSETQRPNSAAFNRRSLSIFGIPCLSKTICTGYLLNSVWADLTGFRLGAPSWIL